jgi:hypothetical protein
LALLAVVSPQEKQPSDPGSGENGHPEPSKKLTMEEFIKALFQLREELKELKGLLLSHLKLTRARLFKEEWVDGHEVSTTLHIDSRKLRTLRNAGKLPYSKIGDKHFYRYSDLSKLLKSNYFKNNPIKDHDQSD